ncbi:MAG: histidine phosphatase family protein [Frankiaceae bacterium]
MGELLLIRHGETEWSRSGRHTSRTDLALTEAGETRARQLAPLLSKYRPVLVLTSPMTRARRTAELAGLQVDGVEAGLSEWDYGALEGRTTEQIRTRYPSWTIWRGPWPGGQTADQVYERVSQVLDRVRPTLADGDVVLVAHGHCLRVLALAWLRLPVRRGWILSLDAGTLSVLGREHGDPSVHGWNQSPL